MKKPMSNEEISFQLVNIYFEEIARLGFKRSLDLDAIINAYFYTLEKVKKKDQVLTEMAKQVMAEEEKLRSQTKEEMIPSLAELKEKLPEKEMQSSMEDSH